LLGGLQSGSDVLNKVVGVLNTHGQADEVVGDAQSGSHLGGN
jgi:hypothetical protein